MKLVDDQGAIVEQYEYDPFGKQSVYDGTGNALGGSAYGVVYGFQGRRHDAETGLMYFRNRYYDPHLGRFLTVDPIGIWGDPLNWGNGWTMSGEVVLKWRDPYGLLTAVIVISDPQGKISKDDLDRAEALASADPDGGMIYEVDNKGKRIKLRKVKHKKTRSKRSKKHAWKKGKLYIEILVGGHGLEVTEKINGVVTRRWGENPGGKKIPILKWVIDVMYKASPVACLEKQKPIKPVKVRVVSCYLGLGNPIDAKKNIAQDLANRLKGIPVEAYDTAIETFSDASDPMIRTKEGKLKPAKPVVVKPQSGQK